MSKCEPNAMPIWSVLVQHHFSRILWESGAAERSGASTALVARTQVRESQCKHLKNLFNSFSATCVAETKAQLALRTP